MDGGVIMSPPDAMKSVVWRGVGKDAGNHAQPGAEVGGRRRSGGAALELLAGSGLKYRQINHRPSR